MARRSNNRFPRNRGLTRESTGRAQTRESAAPTFRETPDELRITLSPVLGRVHRRAVPPAPDQGLWLKQLQELHSTGLLTDSEFAAKRAQVLKAPVEGRRQPSKATTSSSEAMVIGRAIHARRDLRPQAAEAVDFPSATGAPTARRRYGDGWHGSATGPIGGPGHSRPAYPSTRRVNKVALMPGDTVLLSSPGGNDPFLRRSEVCGAPEAAPGQCDRWFSGRLAPRSALGSGRPAGTCRSAPHHRRPAWRRPRASG